LARAGIAPGPRRSTTELGEVEFALAEMQEADQPVPKVVELTGATPAAVRF
jgi:hypothetical protein